MNYSNIAMIITILLVCLSAFAFNVIMDKNPRVGKEFIDAIRCPFQKLCLFVVPFIFIWGSILLWGLIRIAASDMDSSTPQILNDLSDSGLGMVIAMVACDKVLQLLMENFSAPAYRRTPDISIEQNCGGESCAIIDKGNRKKEFFYDWQVVTFNFFLGCCLLAVVLFCFGGYVETATIFVLIVGRFFWFDGVGDTSFLKDGRQLQGICHTVVGILIFSLILFLVSASSAAQDIMCGIGYGGILGVGIFFLIVYTLKLIKWCRKSAHSTNTTIALLIKTAVCGMIICIVQFVLMEKSIPLFMGTKDDLTTAPTRFMVSWFALDFAVVLICSIVCTIKKYKTYWIHSVRIGIYILAGFILILQLLKNCDIQIGTMELLNFEVVSTTFACYIAFDTALSILLEKIFVNNIEGGQSAKSRSSDNLDEGE